MKQRIQWILILCGIGLLIGLYMISTHFDQTESMVIDYSPRHFLNRFNNPVLMRNYDATVEGFNNPDAEEEEEPEPEPSSADTTAAPVSNINRIEVKIYNSPGAGGPPQPHHPPSPRHHPEHSGPYGHMPHYEVIVNDKEPVGPIAHRIADAARDMIFPPLTPYNPIEVDPARCPVCPMAENQPWAEYRALEDDVPAPY